MKGPITFLVVGVLANIAAAGNPAPSFTPVGPEPLNHVSDGAVVFHEGWMMQAESLTEGDGAAISREGFDSRNWFHVTVPTTVLGALVQHGVYPDPYVGTNNLAIPDASEEHNLRMGLAGFSHLPDKSNPWTRPWWFRREFVVPGSFTGKTVWLHLDGINYRADVWLNGRQVARASDVAGMFRRFRFDVTRLVRPGTGAALAVRIHPLDHPGDPIHEQLDGLGGKFGPNGGDGEILRNVTQYCTAGWDWVPPARDRNMGIWQHVWLEGTGPVAVRDPAVFTDVKLPAGDEAANTIRLHIESAVAASEPVEVRVTLVGPGGETVSFSTNVSSACIEPKEVVLRPDAHPELRLRHPRLWWPVTYGDQPLYRLDVEARINGQVSHRLSRQFGIRTVGSFILPSGGRAFTVNGRTLRLTGGAWIPDYLLSWDAQRYRDEVRLMAEGNHTVVRVNGCGIMPPDVFLEECDRRGLMVWEDFSRTSINGDYRKDGRAKSNDPVDCDDPELFLSNMRDTILRLRGRTSLLVWCGGNENTIQQNVGGPLQNEILPELDGSRPWLSSSSANAPWAKQSNCTWTGGPWHLVRLPTYFEKMEKDPKFTARNEIGLPSPMSFNSLARALPGHDRPDARWFPLNVEAGYHDATGNYAMADEIYRADVGESSCLAEHVMIGDLYNGVAYRAIFEAANKYRPRNAGTHLWKVNAAWPSFMWQLFDWYLRPNAGYYSMKSACRPLHIQHSVTDQGIQVVSTLPETRGGLTARIALVDAAGKREHTEEWPVTAPADATISVGVLPDLVMDGRLHFLALDLLDEKGFLLDRQVKWVQRDNKWQELIGLPPARVKARVLSWSEVADETLYRIEATNTSGIPAAQVWLEIIRGGQGMEVLPCFWSDNALLLMPGERRELCARFRSELLGGAEPHLMVEGWNVLPCETDAAGHPVPLGISVARCEAVVEADGPALRFTATQRGPAGARWTTWPVAVRVDGEVWRYTRIAVRTGTESFARLTLCGLPTGSHRLVLGDGPECEISIRAARSAR